MDADELQARPVALEELCKQPEKDRPHLLVLARTHKHTRTKTNKATLLIKQLFRKCGLMVNDATFVFRVMGYRQLVPSFRH